MFRWIFESSVMPGYRRPRGYVPQAGGVGRRRDIHAHAQTERIYRWGTPLVLLYGEDCLVEEDTADISRDIRGIRWQAEKDSTDKISSSIDVR